jgi:hypothetical protein
VKISFQLREASGRLLFGFSLLNVVWLEEEEGVIMITYTRKDKPLLPTNSHNCFNQFGFRFHFVRMEGWYLLRTHKWDGIGYQAIAFLHA